MSRMEGIRDSHSISLKVLRLSRPSLSQQFPLDVQEPNSAFYIDAPRALDTSDGDFDPDFVLSPALTLPPAFGAAYVGETFSCTLCANNELAAESDRRVSNVKVIGEMQTPSGTMPLDLEPSRHESQGHDIGPGTSMQRLVRFDLREEGNHTLAINVSYSETLTAKDHSALGGRSRSFRKLYQFIARPCLNVRTKISPLKLEPGEEVRGWVLEAQLDNVTDGPVTLRTVTLTPKPPFRTTSLNWDSGQLTHQRTTTCPLLSTRDVMQVAFLIEPSEQGSTTETIKDGRVVLGQLSIQWRTLMGDAGHLSTGWLTTKRR